MNTALTRFSLNPSPLNKVEVRSVCEICKKCLTCNTQHCSRRGGGGAGGVLELHFPPLKHSVPNVLTRMVGRQVRAPNDCFLLNICTEKWILPRFSTAGGRLNFSTWPLTNLPRIFWKLNFSHFTINRRKRHSKIFGFENVREKNHKHSRLCEPLNWSKIFRLQ